MCCAHSPHVHACYHNYIWRYAHKETDYCDTPRIQIVCLHTCKHVSAQIQASSVVIAKGGVVYACDTRAKKMKKRWHGKWVTRSLSAHSFFLRSSSAIYSLYHLFTTFCAASLLWHTLRARFLPTCVFILFYFLFSIIFYFWSLRPV